MRKAAARALHYYTPTRADRAVARALRRFAAWFDPQSSTTTWRQIEEAIECLGDSQLAKHERVQMIGHLRLVRASSLRRERGQGEKLA